MRGNPQTVHPEESRASVQHHFEDMTSQLRVLSRSEVVRRWLWYEKDRRRALRESQGRGQRAVSTQSSEPQSAVSVSDREGEERTRPYGHQAGPVNRSWNNPKSCRSISATQRIGLRPSVGW